MFLNAAKRYSFAIDIENHEQSMSAFSELLFQNDGLNKAFHKLDAYPTGWGHSLAIDDLHY